MIPRFGYPVNPPGVSPRFVGPPQEEIPTATCFSSFPLELCAAALADLKRAGKVNHLGDSQAYPISGDARLEGYRQVLLQTRASDGSFDRDYTRIDSGCASVPLLQSLYPSLHFYRARLLILEPSRQIPWHVDADPRDFCRIHFMIQGVADWRFRRDRQTRTCRMEAGQVWWTSVGWPHTVCNQGAGERVVLIVHADYDHMVQTFGNPVESTQLLQRHKLE